MLEFFLEKTSVEHLDDIMVVENLSFTIPWSRQSILEEITNNNMAIYISARTKERVIGYAGLWKVYGEGHITNIAVHPEYRKNGVGAALLKKLIEMAESDGIYRMTLEVRKSNEAAIHLYSKFRFQPGGVRKGYYADNGEDAIIMWREGADGTDTDWGST